MFRRCHAAARGMVANRAARARSAAIRMGRRRWRSAQAPAKRPKTSTPAPFDPARMPICIGDAPSTRAAVRGRPTLVMVDPILEIAWPPQSLRNSRSRVRPPKRIAALLSPGAIDAPAERSHHLTPKRLAQFLFVGGAHRNHFEVQAGHFVGGGGPPPDARGRGVWSARGGGRIIVGGIHFR